MLKRVLVAVALALSFSVAMSGPASAAGPDCIKVNPKTGQCVITVPTQPTPGPTGGGGGSGKPVPCKDRDGTVVPCQNGSGSWWSNAYFCYITPWTPPPPKTDPVWGGHTDGGVYGCAPRIGPPVPIWLATPPGPGVDPAVLARQAIESMQLKAITVGIVPEPRPGSIGLLGLPTWMWAENPGPTTIGPITRSASAGGFTVTATAHVDRVVWRMGDGQVVTCMGPGTPYADSYGRQSSPDCGYTYSKAGRYTVTATSYWVVDWTGLGQTGQIPLDLTQSTSITMGEAQVVSQ